MPKLADLWTRWFPTEKGRLPLEGGGERDNKGLLTAKSGRGLAVLALLGAALMWLGRGGEPETPVAGKAADELPAPVAVAEHRQSPAEQRLAALLSQITGVGRVDVYITYESSAEQVLAEEVTTERNTNGGGQAGSAVTNVRETRRPVTLRDDNLRTEKPLVLLEREPQVRGVVVVAEGAASAQVRYDLAKAVETALGVPAHRIAVFARRN